ncbi:hypothetical protein BKA70DRAFT_690733 [Coprinopsis sp. MPI-PUGE-AT-0042]|nr:hypothetical protein BKA70DRAFT_690733 [Coprinopsis sp. MPI-PUGE-AT-0042]
MLGAPKKASGGCKKAGALRSRSRCPVRWLGTRRKGLGKQNRRLINSSQHQTSYRRSTQSSVSIPLSSCIATTMCMVPVHSSLNPYGGLPKHPLHPLSLQLPPGMLDLPVLHPSHSSLSISTNWHCAANTVPCRVYEAGQPAKSCMLCLCLTSCWSLLREVQAPIHVRYAEPRGEDLTLPFEGPRAFFSCNYDARVQDPWFLVTRHLDSDSPDAQQLKIHVAVGDRQVDLQVEFGTAFTILACFFGASLGLGRHVDGWRSGSGGSRKWE